MAATHDHGVVAKNVRPLSELTRHNWHGQVALT